MSLDGSVVLPDRIIHLNAASDGASFVVRTNKLQRALAIIPVILMVLLLLMLLKRREKKMEITYDGIVEEG